jgi:hypothetical protein
VGAFFICLGRPAERTKRLRRKRQEQGCAEKPLSSTQEPYCFPAHRRATASSTCLVHSSSASGYEKSGRHSLVSVSLPHLEQRNRHHYDHCLTHSTGGKVLDYLFLLGFADRDAFHVEGQPRACLWRGGSAPGGWRRNTRLKQCPATSCEFLSSDRKAIGKGSTRGADKVHRQPAG